MFSYLPTATAIPVQGGSEVRTMVSALANENYHWRARVLDGNGVPSQWVSFSANATDFTYLTLSPAVSPISPGVRQAFAGDSVTFCGTSRYPVGPHVQLHFGGTQAATAAQLFKHLPSQVQSP